MKNILIIGSGLKPNENANGICTERLIHELRNRNHNVVYVDWMFCNHQSYIRNDGTVIFGLSTQSTEEKSINIFDTLTDSDSVLLKFEKALRILYNRLIFPFESLRKTKIICKMTHKICLEFNINTVVSVYQPFITLYAGYNIKKKRKDIVFIPYYLDLISNPYIEKPLLTIPYQRKQLSHWENKINKIADRSIYMIHSLAFHAKNHDDKVWYQKIKYLDIPLFSPKVYSLRPIEKQLKLKELVFCGYIGDHRNIEFFLNVLHELPEYIYITFVGNITVKQRTILNSFIRQMPDRIRYMGYIPNDEIDQILEKAYCLINFGVKSSTAISAKIFEYISYRKPIILTYSRADDPSIAPLNKYPCSLLIDENRNDFAKIAREVHHFLVQAEESSIDLTGLEKEYELNQPRSFADFIETIN